MRGSTLKLDSRIIISFPIHIFFLMRSLSCISNKKKKIIFQFYSTIKLTSNCQDCKSSYRRYYRKDCWGEYKRNCVSNVYLLSFLYYYRLIILL